MSCAQRDVIAIIKNGSKCWVGSNWCNNPQEVCPRGPQDNGDYRLCDSLCRINAHAEVDACRKAGEQAKGATLYLIGHDHCCENCKKVMDEFEIKRVVIVTEPKL